MPENSVEYEVVKRFAVPVAGFLVGAVLGYAVAAGAVWQWQSVAKLVEKWEGGRDVSADSVAALNQVEVGAYVEGVHDAVTTVLGPYPITPAGLAAKARCLDNASEGQTVRDFTRAVMFLLQKYDYPNANAASAILEKACNL